MSTSGLLIVLFAFGILAPLYFLPTILAVLRQKANTGPIVLVNVFLGWTFIGWFVALIWALSTQAVDSTPTARMTARLCAGCGQHSQGGTRFCPHCGQAAS